VFDEFDANSESDESSDWGGAKGKSPISLKQNTFSLKQLAKWIEQPNFGTFTKCKKVRVAGFLERNHQSIIPGKNCLKQLQDGQLHGETAIANLLETYKTWLPVETFDNAESIRQQWREMVLK
jgi:hypothetical protein